MKESDWCHPVPTCAVAASLVLLTSRSAHHNVELDGAAHGLNVRAHRSRKIHRFIQPYRPCRCLNPGEGRAIHVGPSRELVLAQSQRHANPSDVRAKVLVAHRSGHRWIT